MKSRGKTENLRIYIHSFVPKSCDVMCTRWEFRSSKRRREKKKKIEKRGRLESSAEWACPPLCRFVNLRLVKKCCAHLTLKMQTRETCTDQFHQRGFVDNLRSRVFIIYLVKTVQLIFNLIIIFLRDKKYNCVGFYSYFQLTFCFWTTSFPTIFQGNHIGMRWRAAISSSRLYVIAVHL